MDDDSCLMNVIEIVPVDDYGNCSESSDVELSPCDVKVCMLFIHCLCIVTVIFLDSKWSNQNWIGQSSKISYFQVVDSESEPLLVCSDSDVSECTSEYHGLYRSWKVLEFYCAEFQALESPGKRHRSCKNPGKSWNCKPPVLELLVLVWVVDKLQSTYSTCWTNLGSLRYNNITAGIAFPFLCCNANTLTTDFVYALLRAHATHVCEWNMSWKVLEKTIFEFWKTLEFGLCKSWKKHFNVCTNRLEVR